MPYIVMEPLTISGIEFYRDDTIETIQQLIALREESHPDRLFIEVQGSFPSTYYSTNMKHWMELFDRLSLDGKTITLQQMDIYLKKIRVETSVVPKAYTLDEWRAVPEELKPIYSPDGDTFTEWRILGVADENSVILDIPPPATIVFPAKKIPVVQPKSLFETFHPYEVIDFRVTEAPSDVSDSVKLVYFSALTDSTPANISALSGNIEKLRSEFKSLLSLRAPSYQKTSILKVAWEIPLIGTKFHIPYVQFEQMFYGLTLSKDVPYVGMFTSKSEALRHKFYVENPKEKIPHMAPSLLKAWLNTTMPQQAQPTLLIYRGDATNSFDHMIITKSKIIVQVHRSKDNKDSEEKLRKIMMEYLNMLDSIIPFLDKNDIDETRWELNDLSMIVTYKDEIETLNRNRVNCMQSMFGIHEDGFQLLRAEHTSQNISAQLLQAYQLLNDYEGQPTAKYLADEMSITDANAQQLINEIQDLISNNFKFERALKGYPTIKFFAKQVVVQHAIKSERILKYIDILRYVLTETNPEINAICPEDLSVVQAVSSVPQQAVADLGDFEDIELDLEGLVLDEPEEVVSNIGLAVAPSAPKKRTTKVAQESVKGYGYFHERLKKFDPDTYESIDYPRMCEKKKQVVVVTDEDNERIRHEKGEDYTLENIPEDEKLRTNNPDGTFICPEYWCTKDEIPLRKNQLVDNACPICGGKIQTTENKGAGYTLIERFANLKKPGYQQKEIGNVPCCFKTANRGSKPLEKSEPSDETYIKNENVKNLAPLRAAYVSDELKQRLQIETDYKNTVNDKNHLIFGKSDVFLIGLGHPSETLPKLFNQPNMNIPNPKDVPDKVKTCSFFQQWRTKSLETNIEGIIEDIDRAFKNKQLSFIHELEYTAMFLDCQVILIDPTTYQVHCGFWNTTSAPHTRTIAVIGNLVLGYLQRKRQGSSVYNTIYSINLRARPFGEKVWPYLVRLHKQSCSVQYMPTYEDAVTELIKANKPQYKVILDPIGRMQAIFVPGEVLIPFAPTSESPPNTEIRRGYHDLKDEELPNGATLRSFLANTSHPGLKVIAEHEDSEGRISEIGLTSGLRIPIQPEIQENPKYISKEITQTIRQHNEDMLVEGQANKADKQLAQNIAYSSEVYSFLLYTLSKDIEVDRSGDILNPTFTSLRASITEQSPNILKELKDWFKKQGYVGNVETPTELVNKVRTPCGQFTKKDVCEKSTLCGWDKNSCKIKVNPVIDINDVLKRIAKTLKDNPKQRSLVLDNRLSPFFSTILYFELPHELFTTSLSDV